MTLIDNWRKSHKLWSVRLSGLLATLAGLDWLVPSLSEMVPKWLYFALAVAVVAARVVAQPKVTGNG